MLGFLRARLRQGTPTAGVPPEGAGLPERFRGRPTRDLSRCAGDCEGCRSIPTRLLAHGGSGAEARLDVGAAHFAPEEAACLHGSLAFTRDYRMAARSREDLQGTEGEVRLAEALDERCRALFGRSLRLRSVVAGSCNGCEMELVALGNVVFDMARFGVQFVASPRHADGIVVTGAVSRNMRSALYDTLTAVPEPRLVIAVGVCAVNGGPFRGSLEVEDGVPDDVPVDLWIPGCPPHPFTVMDGLLRLLGRLDGGRKPVEERGVA